MLTENFLWRGTGEEVFVFLHDNFPGRFHRGDVRGAELYRCLLQPVIFHNMFLNDG